MLRVTQRAIDHLRRLREERGFDTRFGARFARSSGPQKIGLSFVDNADPADRVVEGQDLPIYVASDVVPLLKDVTIDLDTREGRSRLRIARTRTAATAR